jgi:aspartate racemase
MVDKVLGVLGGMGPLASAQFMVRLTLLTSASRDQEHIPAVLWSDPRVPDRTAALLGRGTDPLPWLMRGIEGLKAAGCGTIVIPCNTAHGWFEPMAREAGVPILHIVDAAATDLRRIGVFGGTIGLMGTAGTLAMRLYQDRLGAQGWDILEPEPAQMERLVTPAIEAVKANRVAEAFEPLAEVVNSLAERGASAVVLGCTEIPLGIQAGPAEALRVPVVDTIDALARRAIAWARPRANFG